VKDHIQLALKASVMTDKMVSRKIFSGMVRQARSSVMRVILLLITLPVFSGRAQDPAGIAFFEQKIRPALVEHCYECHSAAAKKLKGNLYLDSQAGWRKGGDSGAMVIVPGHPESSLLLRTIQHLEEDMKMPPKKPKLPDAVIADFIAWVKMGAPDPRDGGKVEAKRADKSWWSLQPLSKTFAHASIDGFIEAKLAEKKMNLNPPADARSLIRRMTYDLTGLPPTREEVVSFEKSYQENSRSAVEELVERLLASPRYGERWGRHWLDVVRFGESNGFERNFVIDDLWPFRDYVIQSINEDKPFSDFIKEHLAGDVIGRDKPSVEVGSAFLVAGPYDDVGNQDKVAQLHIRAATLDDMITATSGAFLGLTINCARCHNHKFDPIPTEDYYRLRSAFEGVTHGRRVIATKEQREASVAAINPLAIELKTLETERDRVVKDVDARARKAFSEMKFARPKIDGKGAEEVFEAVEAKHLRFVIHALTSSHQQGTKGKRLGLQGGKLTEFQIWSADDPPRNVALASNGTRAEGAKSTIAEDFPEAYGPQYCIDGKLGEAWFIGEPAVLTLSFSKLQRINRIRFMNVRDERGVDEGKVRGATPCEYEVQVSLDGETWTTVASDKGREPWTAAHGVAGLREKVVTAEEQEALATLEKRISKVQRALEAVPKLPQIWAGNHAQVKELTFVHKGGDPSKPGEVVVPASLSVLDHVTKPFQLTVDAPGSERRLALAEWITCADNPLTPRVLANRAWQYHFGTGIVDTPSDFGFLGSKPTHPELLDYLAGKLVGGEWRLKSLHREILLSRTYQQSASSRDSAVKEDKDARLLWRFPPRRLSAEEIRDTMLAVAGKLQLSPMGGPGFRLYKVTQNNVSTYFPLDVHGPETYRRAVYHQNARASVVDVLNDFDLPDIAFAAPKRANTTTPLQALTLLNHSFTLDMARALAEAVREGDPISEAYRRVFQREPVVGEYAAASRLVGAHGMEAFCRALLNANEILYLE
jgi:hypothetical protein